MHIYKNKKLLFLVCISCYGGANAADVTSRAYIEGSVGICELYAKTRGITSANIASGAGINPPPSAAGNAYNSFLNTITSGKGGPNLSSIITVGYDCKIKDSNLMMGIFGGGCYSAGSYKATYQVEKDFLQGTNSNFVVAAGDVNYANIRSNLFFNVGFKIGIVASSSWLLALKMGFQMNRISIKLHRTADALLTSSVQSFKKTKLVRGFTVAPELSYNVNSRFAVGVSYEMFFAGKARYNFNNLFNWSYKQPDKTAAIVLKPRISTCLITFKWLFPTACSN